MVDHLESRAERVFELSQRDTEVMVSASWGRARLWFDEMPRSGEWRRRRQPWHYCIVSACRHPRAEEGSCATRQEAAERVAEVIRQLTWRSPVDAPAGDGLRVGDLLRFERPLGLYRRGDVVTVDRVRWDGVQLREGNRRRLDRSTLAASTSYLGNDGSWVNALGYSDMVHCIRPVATAFRRFAPGELAWVRNRHPETLELVYAGRGHRLPTAMVRSCFVPWGWTAIWQGWTRRPLPPAHAQATIEASARAPRRFC